MTRHASPGEGTFWWRTLASGKRVYGGRSVVAGKHVTASLTLQKGQSEREVERRVKARIREKVALQKAGLNVEAQAQKLTLLDYGEQIWLPDVARSREASSHLTYATLWRRHIVGGARESLKKDARLEQPFALARRRVADLRIQHVRDWLTDLESRGRKSGTLASAFETLLAILRQAKGDYPGQFPNLQAIEDAAGRLKPKHERPRRIFPTPVQLRLLFAQLGQTESGWADADPPHGTIVLLVYYTAKRISEVLGLRWIDWDEVNGGLWIRGQQDHHTRRLREYPKHDRHQYLALPPEAVALLRAHRAAELAAGGPCRAGDQVFTVAGEPIDHKRVWRHYKAALAAAGLPSFRLHDLRGGWAMAARVGGVDDRTIAEQLGHSSLSTLHEHYFDRSNPMQAMAAEIGARAVRAPLSSVGISVSGEDEGDSARSSGHSAS